MKSRLLLAFCLPFALSAQQTITSTQNGAASNPLTWDCFCFPTTDDNIVVNHAVTMDLDWAITASGSIKVNAGGSLLQSGLHALLVDGIGSEYINLGNSSFNQIAFINGASAQNDGHFSITEALYVGPGSSFDNAGLLDGIDSLMTEGTFSSNGTIYTGNLLNTGTMNSSGPIGADSVGNTGTYSFTAGYLFCNAFGNSGTYTMSGTGFIETAQSWYNSGDFIVGSNNEIISHIDFYTGDTIDGSASLINNGMIEVFNNFYNSHSISGTGNFCVANDTYNSGPLSGSFDFCDNTGGNFDFNIGTISGGITFCQSGCSVGLTEFGTVNVQVYPNPSEGMFSVNGVADNTEVVVYSLAGQRVVSTRIHNSAVDLSNLPIGTYLLIFADDNNAKPVKINIQK